MPPSLDLEALVAELEALRARFGPGAGKRKRTLLSSIARREGGPGELVARLHETLLFLRAFPDSAPIWSAAERALRRIVERVEALPAEERAAIDERGIAGTSIYTSYSLGVVRALRDRHPGAVALYPQAEGSQAALGVLLGRALLPGEVEALADGYVSPARWLDLARREGSRTRRGRQRSDLDRVLALVDDAAGSPRARELLWEALGLSIRWDLGRGPGSRTLARAPRAEVGYQTEPFSRDPFDLRAEVGRGPLPLRRAEAAEAARWIDLCRDVLAVRLREVHTYNHASGEDVTVADAGHGLRIAVIGVAPPARHAVRTFVGYVIVRNDVPIGYGDAVLLSAWGEINFHVFETFRQAESSRTYAAVLRLFHHHYGTRFVFLNRYQFGHHNEDAIRSGAFWFYEKLGFRPHAPGAVRVWQAERAAMARHPGHRTAPRELRALARHHMDLSLDLSPGTRRSIEQRYRGFHPLALGLALTRAVERAFHGQRTEAARAASARLRARLGGAWAGDEAQALEGLAPLLEFAIKLDAWSRSELRDLALLIRAKAAPSEREYLSRTQGHPRLRDALLRLGGAGGDRAAKRTVRLRAG